MADSEGLRVYFYMPAERRVVLTEVASVPSTGEVVTCGRQSYRVAAVHASRRPAILTLQACAALLPAAT